MTKKETEIIRAFECELWNKQEKLEKEHGEFHELTRIARNKWASVYDLCKKLNVECDVTNMDI